MSDTILYGTNLSHVDFSRVTYTLGSKRGEDPVVGLTQAQIDHASAEPNASPNLLGVTDIETGEKLVWRGKPLDG